MATSVVKGSFPIEGLDLEIPFIELTGAVEGPRFALTAGIHADEYVGEQALIELAQELAQVELKGSVIIVPVANTASFARRGTSMVPDGPNTTCETNLNRVFPGNPAGNPAQRFADVIFTKVIKDADYYVDLHSGDYYEDLAPHLYYVADQPCSAAARALAAVTDVRIVVPCYGKTWGGTYASAAGAGVPAILLERGGMGAWSYAEVDGAKADVLSLLRSVGILEGAARDFRPTQVDFEEMYDLYAPMAGFWYPTKHSGEFFAAGECVGTVRDTFGTVLHEVVAPKAGVVVYQTGSLNVVKDGPMIAWAFFA